MSTPTNSPMNSPMNQDPQRLLAALHHFTEHREQLQEQLKADIEEIAREEFTGETLQGGVVARVSGRGHLIAVEIGTLAKRNTDNLTLGEAVVEAVRRAEAAAKSALVERTMSVMLGQPLAGLIPRERLERLL